MIIARQIPTGQIQPDELDAFTATQTAAQVGTTVAVCLGVSVRTGRNAAGEPDPDLDRLRLTWDAQPDEAIMDGVTGEWPPP